MPATPRRQLPRQEEVRGTGDSAEPGNCTNASDPYGAAPDDSEGTRSPPRESGGHRLLRKPRYFKVTEALTALWTTTASDPHRAAGVGWAGDRHLAAARPGDAAAPGLWPPAGPPAAGEGGSGRRGLSSGSPRPLWGQGSGIALPKIKSPPPHPNHAQPLLSNLHFSKGVTPPNTVPHIGFVVDFPKSPELEGGLPQHRDVASCGHTAEPHAWDVLGTTSMCAGGRTNE